MIKWKRNKGGNINGRKQRKTKQSDDINVSIGTTVFIAVLTSIAFLAFVVWVSLKIEGMA